MSNKLKIIENWGYPNTVWFGNGRINDLSKVCQALGIKKPLLVTDKNLSTTTMIAKAIEINRKNSFSAIKDDDRFIEYFTKTFD